MHCSRVANGPSRFALGALLAVSLAGPVPSASAREVIDATGARVTIPSARPSRIVTLAPSLAELAAEIDPTGLDRLVGVTEYTDFPAALAGRARVGRYDRFNLEQVAALRPELVLATRDGNPPEQVNRLRELGLPVVVTGSASLAEVEASFRLAGTAMGDAQRGEALAREFAGGIAGLRRRAEGRPGPRLRALLQVGDEPFVVAGARSFLHEAVSALGIANVYADLGQAYPRPSLEDAIRRRPDRVVIFDLGGQPERFERVARVWRERTGLPAASVLVVSGDRLARPTSRLLAGLNELERSLFETAAGGGR